LNQKLEYKEGFPLCSKPKRNPPEADTQRPIRPLRGQAKKFAPLTKKQGKFLLCLPPASITYDLLPRTMPTRTLRASKLVNPCRQNHRHQNNALAKRLRKAGKNKATTSTEKESPWRG